MKNLKRIFCVIFCIIFSLSTTCTVSAEENNPDESIPMFVTKTVDLKEMTQKEIKNVFEEYGLEYDEECTYEKIEVVQPVGRATYNGYTYRFINQYSNKPIKTIKKTGKTAYSTYAKSALDVGTSIGLGFTSPYIWVPYTVLGVEPSKLFEKSTTDPSQYIMTQVYTHVTSKFCQFYRDGEWVTRAGAQHAYIEDTTTAYVLKNKTTELYTSVTKKDYSYMDTPHFYNNTYLLEKAYYCLKYGFPSYAELL